MIIKKRSKNLSRLNRITLKWEEEEEEEGKCLLASGERGLPREFPGSDCDT